ncbi:hypothetical protein BKA61DRAFT_92823 [Leptodontidium sp. MPI-SDFR-AT-0119]|nr:hypothetical protein BKA61DRAFT_92823 [Leptodontidium sp. MPI-SDFR-AT-0119]
MNPHNWSLTTRVGATILIASIGLIVGFASSVDSAAITQAVEEFGASEGAESLATGLLLVGFVAGALFAGPFSDRRTVSRPHRHNGHLHDLDSAINIIPQPRCAAHLLLPSRFLRQHTPNLRRGFHLRPLGPMERFYAFPVRKRRIHGSHFRSRGRWIHRPEQPRLVAVVRIDHAHHLGPHLRSRHSLPT